MNKEQLPEIAIQADTIDLLEDLISSFERESANPVLEYLERELGRAHILISSEPVPNVVTMHSTLTFEDMETGQKHRVTLVYPHEANITKGNISILSPIGAALIGMYVGQSITWYTPNKQSRVLKVLEVERPCR